MRLRKFYWVLGLRFLGLGFWVSGLGFRGFILSYHNGDL